MKQHYIFYDTSTGKIENSRYFGEAQKAKHLELNPRLDYIDNPANVNVRKGVYHTGGTYSVNTVTKELVFTPQPPASSKEILDYARGTRNLLLKRSDWTQFPDAPISDTLKQSYKTYRQELRDLPAQYPDITDYEDIVWPTRPS